MSYESPTYTILHKEGHFEIRQYDEFYTSSVKENTLGGNTGFSILFSYISGDNQFRQPMAMTVPVINEMTSSNMTMEFVIPKKFYETGIPQPTANNVLIRHYPAQIMASYRFSGSIDPQKLNRLVNQLLEFINENGMTVISPVRMARYNSPFTLPFLRRNEILFTVEPIKK